MKSFRLLILLVASSLLTGCEDQFLEKFPLDQLTEGNFYVTAEDATLAINAAYSLLQQPGMYRQNAFRWGAKTDEMFRASDWYNYTYSPSDPNTGSNTGWAPAFQGILTTNIIFQKVPGMAIDENLKKRILGEAAFLRGFYYYYLVRWYGDVPIILDVPTSTTNFSVPRDPAEKVYEQIIKDWTLAIENLPKKSEYARSELGRATKGAAQTMLAELYLYRASEGLKKDQYQNVLSLTQEVIASGEYQLENNFADIFMLANENGRESVFEVQFQKGNLGTGSNANTWITTYNSTSVQDAFFTTWDATDKRRAVSIIAPGEMQGDWRNNTPFYHQRKLIVGIENANGEAGNTNDSPKNFVVQRYANVLLMNAEAQNELNPTPSATAISQVNQIRTRAGLAPLAATLAKEDLRQAIREERRRELAFEGYRWFDLVRYERMGLGGGAVSVLGTASTPYYNSNFRWPKHALQPIPQTEIDNNPALTQNPEY